MNAFIASLLTIAAVSLVGISLTLTLRGKSSDARSKRGLPSLTLTHHAKQRMVERNVSLLQIDQLIASPTRVRRDPRNSSVRLEREIGGRTLIVWVAEPWPAAEIIVKTTAWAETPLVFKIPTGTAGRVIGRGGATIRRIETDRHVRVSIDDSGSLCRISGDRTSADAAMREILALVDGVARTSSLIAA